MDKFSNCKLHWNHSEEYLNIVQQLLEKWRQGHSIKKLVWLPNSQKIVKDFVAT